MEKIYIIINSIILIFIIAIIKSAIIAAKKITRKIKNIKTQKKYNEFLKKQQIMHLKKELTEFEEFKSNYKKILLKNQILKVYEYGSNL